MEIKDNIMTQKKYHERKGAKILYIVIHDTANTCAGQNQLANLKWFNLSDVESSQHFIVDDHQILRILDEVKYQAWHVGDGSKLTGNFTQSIPIKITNTNSIGIEICINNDGNYDQQVLNAAELQAYLQKKYNVPLERIVRHYDQSGKICPGSMYNKATKTWPRWAEFKQTVQMFLNQ